MYVDNLWVKVISLKKLPQTGLSILLALSSSFYLTLNPAWCQTPSTTAQDLDLSPEVIKNSPVLQRWQRQIPNVLDEIRNDPSFPTRLRFGYSHISTNGQGSGVHLGVEDILIGNSRLTVSGDYHTAFSGNRNSYGVNFNYYLRPLGSYVNVAPVIGYRYLEVEQYSTSGVNLGAKLLLVLSRGGGADISLTQSWVAPGTSSEAGLTSLSVGYAVTQKLRIATNIERQNTKASQDSRLGLFLEWIVGN